MNLKHMVWQVMFANEMGAIDKLLMSDKLFRAHDLDERRK